MWLIWWPDIHLVSVGWYGLLEVLSGLLPRDPFLLPQLCIIHQWKVNTWHLWGLWPGFSSVVSISSDAMAVAKYSTIMQLIRFYIWSQLPIPGFIPLPSSSGHTDPFQLPEHPKLMPAFQSIRQLCPLPRMFSSSSPFYPSSLHLAVASSEKYSFTLHPPQGPSFMLCLCAVFISFVEVSPALIIWFTHMLL